MPTLSFDPEALRRALEILFNNRVGQTQRPIANEGVSDAATTPTSPPVGPGEQFGYDPGPFGQFLGLVTMANPVASIAAKIANNIPVVQQFMTQQFPRGYVTGVDEPTFSPRSVDPSFAQDPTTQNVADPSETHFFSDPEEFTDLAIDPGDTPAAEPGFSDVSDPGNFADAGVTGPSEGDDSPDGDSPGPGEFYHGGTVHGSRGIAHRGEEVIRSGPARKYRKVLKAINEDNIAAIRKAIAEVARAKRI